MEIFVFDLNHFAKRLFNKISLFFFDLQSFGNFDWCPSLGPQPLNSMDSKHFSNQLKFILVSFVSFWLSKCQCFTKERCRKHQQAMFSMENRDNSHTVGWKCIQPSCSGFEAGWNHRAAAPLDVVQHLSGDSDSPWSPFREKKVTAEKT